MNALESLVRRVRETEFPVARLRISAPDALIAQMLWEFEARGETPSFGNDVVHFGPHLSVWRDADLPDDTFKIQSLAGNVTQ